MPVGRVPVERVAALAPGAVAALEPGAQAPVERVGHCSAEQVRARAEARRECCPCRVQGREREGHR
ncbi:putative lipoprotein [Streptomyces azureus]|uniref:Putative lipoprotein n=1 Tax=Streptomyces azureus TaxID=146537 RepID=A0A0K8PK01_STRAJ|nr:putative lipoprotein [Streptomyces azureus]